MRPPSKVFFESLSLEKIPSDALAPEAFAVPDFSATGEAEVPDAEASNAPTASLSGRVSRGLGWTSFGSVAIQIMALLRSAVLARLLLQADFGLMGMAATLTGALGVLTSTGMGSSIVAGKFESETKLHRHINTVWTVEVGRGALLSALLWIGAAPTAHFYQEPRLAAMLSVMAISPLLSSLNNIGLSLLSRGVQIGRMTQFSLLSNVANLVITLSLAWWWRSVWALVWGQIAGSAISLAISYLFHPYRPRFLIDREALRNAFQFGKWMFVIGVMVYITTTVDNVFVGKLLGAAALGPYMVAYTIANLPSSLVAQIFGTVFFPAFAELGRGQIERLEAVVERTFQLGAALLLLISLPMALFAHEIVGVLFPSRWAAAAGPLTVLVLVGLFRGFIQMISPLILGLNKPEIEAKSKIAEAVIFLALIYPLTIRFGTLGAAWTGVVVYFFALITRYRMACHLAPRAFTKLPQIVMRLIGASIGGALAGEATRGVLRAVGWNANLTVLILAGGVTLATTLSLMMWVSPPLRHQFAPLVAQLTRRA